MSTFSSSVQNLKFHFRLRERLRPALAALDAIAVPGTALSAIYRAALRPSGLEHRKLASLLHGLLPTPP